MAGAGNAVSAQSKANGYEKFNKRFVLKQGTAQQAAAGKTATIGIRHKKAAAAPALQTRRAFGRTNRLLGANTVARRLGKKSAATGTTIYGSMMYCGTWTEEMPEYGIYSFSSASYSPERLTESEIGVAAGGGVLVGDKYYTIDQEDFWGIIFCYLTTYDAETFKVIDEGYVEETSCATDMTYDPVTGKVYGSFTNDANSGFVWGTLDLETGYRTMIESLNIPLLCVACNEVGTCFAIDTNGNLCTVEKETGKISNIGPTGVKPELCVQSATFDPVTGTLYWAACVEDGSSALYSVNTSTGEATKVEAFPNGEQYTGIFIKKPLAASGAPGMVENLNAEFTGGSTTGIISFTMPKQTFGGEDLSGDITYVIKANGSMLDENTALADADVRAEVTSPTGMVTFDVLAHNAEGDSPATNISLFVGKDTPTAPTDITLEVSDPATYQLTLQWKAPQSTVNGGWLDAEGLVYDVTRMPDNKKVASGIKTTTFTEMVPVEQLSLYYYKVTPRIGEMTGEQGMSNRVKLGEYCTVPYLETFEDASALDMFTIINPHGDYTWEWKMNFVAGQGTASCNFDFNNPKDDWLITPPIQLEPGYTYKLQFDTYSKRVYPERFEVKMGKGNTVDDMTVTLVKDTTMTTEEYVPDVIGKFESDVTVDASGVYYFGFHAMSEVHMLDLNVTNISVTQTSSNSAPGRVTDLTATAGANGELKATLTFNAPEINAAGGKIDKIDKIEVLAGKEVLEPIDNPTPGQKLTAKVTAVQGNNNYTVIAYNENGAGLDAKITVYAGVTIPGKATNAKLIEVGGKAVLTWDAPQAGANGGYIDPAKLNYVIVRGSDYEIVANGITSTTFTDDPMVSGKQSIMAYLIYAANEAGMGDPTVSNPIVMGDNYYTLPFAETFKGSTINTVPWCLDGNGESSWWLTKDSEVTSQDGDGGFIYFVADNPSEWSNATTCKISLAGSINPTLKFYYWYGERSKGNQRLDVRVTTDYNNFTTIETIDFSNLTERPGWIAVKLPLKDYINEPFVAISLLATAAAEDNGCIYIDNITVTDDISYNLKVSAFSTPNLLETGQPATFRALVKNEGTADATDYTMELWKDEKVVKSIDGTLLPADEEKIYEFEITPNSVDNTDGTYHVYANFPKDMNTDNNRSEDIAVKAYTPSWPAVTTLTGNTDGSNANLKWEAPAEASRTKSATDSFEDYTTFSIAPQQGDWTLVDVDGTPTYSIMYQGVSLKYPNAGAKMAYQIFSAKEAGIDYSVCGMHLFEGHTGDKVIAAFPDADGANDDWLISPELSGEEQVVTFYAQSTIPQFGYEEFEFLTSDNGIDLTDFVKVDGVGGYVPFEWTKYSVVIPAGTKHFAIRCVSRDTYMFMVDDVTFATIGGEKEQLAVVGYNVYRDGELITPKPVKTTNYIDTQRNSNKYEYRVSVVYAQGESKCSDALSLDFTTGITENTAGGIKVSAKQGAIVIDNALGHNVTVFGAGGNIIYNSNAEAQRTVINANTGVHIVKIDGKMWKLMVE